MHWGLADRKVLLHHAQETKRYLVKGIVASRQDSVRGGGEDNHETYTAQ